MKECATHEPNQRHRWVTNRTLQQVLRNYNYEPQEQNILKYIQ